MDGMSQGFMQIVTDIQKFSVYLIALELVILGLTLVFKNKDPDTSMTLKNALKWIIGGTALIFGASSLAAMIASWFH